MSVMNQDKIEFEGGGTFFENQLLLLQSHHDDDDQKIVLSSLSLPSPQPPVKP